MRIGAFFHIFTWICHQQLITLKTKSIKDSKGSKKDYKVNPHIRLMAYRADKWASPRDRWKTSTCSNKACKNNQLGEAIPTSASTVSTRNNDRNRTGGAGGDRFCLKLPVHLQGHDPTTFLWSTTSEERALHPGLFIQNKQQAGADGASDSDRTSQVLHKHARQWLRASSGHFLCKKGRTEKKKEPHTGITTLYEIPAFPFTKLPSLLLISYLHGLPLLSIHPTHKLSLSFSLLCNFSAVTIETFRKSHSHWWASGWVRCIHTTHTLILAVKYT